MVHKSKGKTEIGGEKKLSLPSLSSAALFPEAITVTLLGLFRSGSILASAAASSGSRDKP